MNISEDDATNLTIDFASAADWPSLKPGQWIQEEDTGHVSLHRVDDDGNVIPGEEGKVLTIHADVRTMDIESGWEALADLDGVSHLICRIGVLEHRVQTLTELLVERMTQDGDKG